jgi:hypothetical protein
MSAAKHTPGPWVVSPKFRTPVVGYDVGDGGELLPIVEVVHGYDTKQARANAHLIASAPRLAGALRALLDVALSMDAERQDDRPTEEAYQAALAEAQAALAEARA